MEELEKVFNETKKAARELYQKNKQLDILIDEEWGFSYSDGDLDEIANTLEFGIGNLDFNSFCEIMNEAAR